MRFDIDTDTNRNALGRWIVANLSNYKHSTSRRAFNVKACKFKILTSDKICEKSEQNSRNTACIIKELETNKLVVMFDIKRKAWNSIRWYVSAKHQVPLKMKTIDPRLEVSLKKSSYNAVEYPVKQGRKMSANLMWAFRVRKLQGQNMSDRMLSKQQRHGIAS